jgi:peptide-methionine (R)-S-oxide reductase
MELDRRGFLRGGIGALAALLFFPGRSRGEGKATMQGSGPGTFGKLEKPLSEWKRLLTPEQYAVLFEEATERPGTSPLLREKRPGAYLCAACYLPLFSSDAKYESGTGWPSFFRVLEGRVGTRRDFKLFLPRTEYHCARCGGHQGHVFDDGPPPTGQRYCNNGVALVFVPDGQEPPALRE